MSPSEFEAVMGGVQSLATALAVIAAGVWALFRFARLEESAFSKVKLQRENLAIEKDVLDIQKSREERLRFEEEKSRGAVIELKMSVKQHALPDKPAESYISAVVELANKGTYNTRLEYLGEPFLVYQVDFDDHGKPAFTSKLALTVPVGRDPKITSPSVIVRAGGKETLPFVFRKPAPGLYLVVFTARTDAKEQAEAEKLGFRAPGNWVAKQYFAVA